MDDKRKGKMDDLVDALEKGKSKLMVYGKRTKKASVDLIDALDLQNIIKKHYEDFNMLVFGDEDVVLFNDVKYTLTDAEIRMFKERPTTSRASIASTSTTSRSIVPIASTFNAQAASTAPRGYKKIAMIGCVLGLRAPNDLVGSLLTHALHITTTNRTRKEMG
ncbi:hypothetical protein Tco_1199540 [Tanacetum coccineum]